MIQATKLATALLATTKLPTPFPLSNGGEMSVHSQHRLKFWQMFLLIRQQVKAMHTCSQPLLMNTSNCLTTSYFATSSD